jgi:hypothetical protein
MEPACWSLVRIRPWDRRPGRSTPRLMSALICHDLRRRVRHLKVSFHHTHDTNGERAANNKECQIPSHRSSLLNTARVRRHSEHGCDRRHETSLLSRSDVPPYPPKGRHFRRLRTAYIRSVGRAFGRPRATIWTGAIGLTLLFAGQRSAYSPDQSAEHMRDDSHERYDGPSRPD